MANLNRCMFIGNITKDPELRATQSGVSVTTIDLAVNEEWTDKNGVKQKKTEYVRCVFWDKLASVISQYCKKGSSLYVEGSMKTREWNDKEGNKRYSTEIQGRNIQFLGGKSDQQSQGNQGHQQSPPNNDFIDDDIPF